MRLRWWWQWQQIDELAVDAALMDLRLRWWWQWQQIDELPVVGGSCKMMEGFQRTDMRLVVAAAR